MHFLNRSCPSQQQKILYIGGENRFSDEIDGATVRSQVGSDQSSKGIQRKRRRWIAVRMEKWVCGVGEEDDGMAFE